MRKLLLVGYSAENRTKASGYEHIVDFHDCDYDSEYMDAARLPFGFIKTGQRGKRINLYFLEIFSHIKSRKYDVIHNFYCDNQLLFRYPSKRKFAAIATTHLNYHNFSNYHLKVLRSYDYVIVLNSKEERILSEKGINAVYIPHGFNYPDFSLDAHILDNYKDKINICFSGVCYRDYDTLRFFIDNIKDRDDICLHILGQRKEVKDELRELNQDNIIVYDFLPDDTYYSIFSQCDYSFLPLTFATANNTLLEAEFLGIKTIIPNIEGTQDYASEELNLLYNSHDELKGIIGKLQKEGKSQDLMDYAHRFDWNNVFAKTKDVYDQAYKKYHGED